MFDITKFEPTSNRALVKLIKEKEKIITNTSFKETNAKCVVIKSKIKGVKDGDIVILNKYSGVTFTIGSETYLVVRRFEILGKVKDV
jgi:co-chaperonin GroES (HSP10)